MMCASHDGYALELRSNERFIQTSFLACLGASRKFKFMKPGVLCIGRRYNAVNMSEWSLFMVSTKFLMYEWPRRKHQKLCAEKKGHVNMESRWPI